MGWLKCVSIQRRHAIQHKHTHAHKHTRTVQYTVGGTFSFPLCSFLFPSNLLYQMEHHGVDRMVWLPLQLDGGDVRARPIEVFELPVHLGDAAFSEGHKTRGPLYGRRKYVVRRRKT